jgi:hypothetical protein
VNKPPEQIIRGYLDRHEGSVRVPAHNLLRTWGLREFGADDRKRITAALDAVGIEVEPALDEVERNTQVTLRALERSPGAPPAPRSARRTEDRSAKRRRRRAPSPSRRTTIMLAALALGAVVIGGAALLTRGGSDEQKAEETVRQFIKATNEHDGDKLCDDLVTEEFIEQATGATGDRARDVCKKEFKSLKSPGLSLVRIERTEIDGDEGRVTVVLETSRRRLPQVLRLRKEDGDWRLAASGE